NRKRLAAVISRSLEGHSSLKEKFFGLWKNLYQFYVKEPNVLTFFEQFLNSPFNVDQYPHHLRGELYTFFADGIKQRQLKSVKPEMLLVLVMGSVSATAKLSLFGSVTLT